MKTVVESTDKDLDIDERNLLSVAYKNVVGSRRSAWRVVVSQKQKHPNQTLVDNYKSKIESELTKICTEVIVGYSYAYILM